METNVRYTMAGTFVLVMIALMIIGIIWLSSGFSQEEYSYYVVNMKESISGLGKEGRVEFNGVDVGNVNDMIINAKQPQVVTLILKIKKSTPITQGTRAKLSIRMLSGSTFILLEDKGNNKTPLVAKAGEPYPVIPTEPSILVKIDTIVTDMNNSFKTMSNSFEKISSSVGSLFSRENVQMIKKVLQKLGG